MKINLESFSQMAQLNNKIPQTETGAGIDGQAAQEDFLHEEDHGDCGEHPQAEAGDRQDPGRQPEHAEDHQPDQRQDRQDLRRRRRSLLQGLCLFYKVSSM